MEPLVPPSWGWRPSTGGKGTGARRGVMASSGRDGGEAPPSWGAQGNGLREGYPRSHHSPKGPPWPSRPQRVPHGPFQWFLMDVPRGIPMAPSWRASRGSLISKGGVALQKALVVLSQRVLKYEVPLKGSLSSCQPQSVPMVHKGPHGPITHQRVPMVLSLTGVPRLLSPPKGSHGLDVVPNGPHGPIPKGSPWFCHPYLSCHGSNTPKRSPWSHHPTQGPLWLCPTGSPTAGDRVTLKTGWHREQSPEC